MHPRLERRLLGSLADCFRSTGGGPLNIILLGIFLNAAPPQLAAVADDLLSKDTGRNLKQMDVSQEARPSSPTWQDRERPFGASILDRSFGRTRR
jgi:hypothetical protein